MTWRILDAAIRCKERSDLKNYLFTLRRISILALIGATGVTPLLRSYRQARCRHRHNRLFAQSCRYGSRWRHISSRDLWKEKPKTRILKRFRCRPHLKQYRIGEASRHSADEGSTVVLDGGHRAKPSLAPGQRGIKRLEGEDSWSLKHLRSH